MVQFTPHLHSAVDKNGAVILNSSCNQITTLDAMGGYIWRCLQDGMTPAKVVQHLVSETGEEQQIVEADVAELLSELQNRKLLSTLDSVNRTTERI